MNSFRRKRFRMFFERFQITPNIPILDVGGLPYDWLALSWTGPVLCVSLSGIREGAYGAGNIVYQRKNVLDLEPGGYGVVYSNSLLEHVGRENQQAVAERIRSLAERYWVQTPYRFTPLEPHYWFPFFWTLPHPMRRLIARRYTPLVKPRNPYLGEIDSIHLLDEREMKQLFPDAEIIRERIGGFTKSLIAVG